MSLGDQLATALERLFLLVSDSGHAGGRAENPLRADDDVIAFGRLREGTQSLRVLIADNVHLVLGGGRHC